MENRNPYYDTPTTAQDNVARVSFSPRFAAPVSPSTSRPPNTSYSSYHHTPTTPHFAGTTSPLNLPSPSRSRLDPKYSARLHSSNFVTPSSSSTNQRNLHHSYSQEGGGVDDGFFLNLPHSKSSSLPSPSHACNTPERRSKTSISVSPSIIRRRKTNDLNDTGYGDRFIPSRSLSNINNSPFQPSTPLSSNNNDENEDPQNNTTTTQQQKQEPLLHTLLRSELLQQDNRNQTTSILQFQSPKRHCRSRSNDNSSLINVFHPSPVSPPNKMITMKKQRRIPPKPFKILDAPGLIDNFYSDLLDWSSQNTLAVALSNTVYIYSPASSKVTKLTESPHAITSISWSRRGNHLAIACDTGDVEIWDVSQQQKMCSYKGYHSSRVAALSWNGPVLASGGRDKIINLRDVRCEYRSSNSSIAKLKWHRKEVCGLKWSEDGRLASGGDDNRLLIWDIKQVSSSQSNPVFSFDDHTAAVKALAWSPHQHGVLASGGGATDRTIRFWNTSLGKPKGSIVDVKSQVCNLAWSPHGTRNELISTHGYSSNHIVVWDYPSMVKVASLKGHGERVLHFAMSPDGSNIVTGAGDETLKFWHLATPSVKTMTRFERML